MEDWSDYVYSRCDIAYRVVEKIVNNEECKVDVQHVCEEHIHVPVIHHQHHHPEPVYGPPEPLKHPEPGYGPPEPQKYPKEGYGLAEPLKLPVTGYSQPKPLKQPQTSYGPPTELLEHPDTVYGPPEQSYGPQESAYSQPEPPQFALVYGPPPPPPSTSTKQSNGFVLPQLQNPILGFVSVEPELSDVELLLNQDLDSPEPIFSPNDILRSEKLKNPSNSDAEGTPSFYKTNFEKLLKRVRRQTDRMSSSSSLSELGGELMLMLDDNKEIVNDDSIQLSSIVRVNHGCTESEGKVMGKLLISMFFGTTCIYCLDGYFCPDLYVFPFVIYITA